MTETKGRPTLRFTEEATVVEAYGKIEKVTGRDQTSVKCTGCLIGREMRADRGTGGSCYWADSGQRTGLCVLEQTDFSADANKPSFPCQDGDVCPPLDHADQLRTFHPINRRLIR